ncbi:MAG: ABC transporter permease [Halocynthiibacter sp.]
MFVQNKPMSRLQSAAVILDLIFVSTVRNIRKGDGSPLMALLKNAFQAMAMVAIFVLMFSVLGLRSAALRGDFLLYVMSGIFNFMTHVKSVGAIAGSEGPTAPMMKHAPMNTTVAIFSSALEALYTQVLALSIILLLYHVLMTPVEIYYWPGALGMLILSWFTGCAVGMVFLAIKPWSPGATRVLTMLYQRANMLASGKMFVANMMPSFMISLFDWNPLFHIIDQCRGFVFINYSPRYSDWRYAFWVGVGLLMLGFLMEFINRRKVSLSWGI